MFHSLTTAQRMQRATSSDQNIGRSSAEERGDLASRQTKDGRAQSKKHKELREPDSCSTTKRLRESERERERERAEELAGKLY